MSILRAPLCPVTRVVLQPGIRMRIGVKSCEISAAIAHPAGPSPIILCRPGGRPGESTAVRELAAAPLVKLRGPSALFAGVVAGVSTPVEF